MLKGKKILDITMEVHSHPMVFTMYGFFKNIQT
jgi:hypothetical protein